MYRARSVAEAYLVGRSFEAQKVGHVSFGSLAILHFQLLQVDGEGDVSNHFLPCIQDLCRRVQVGVIGQ
jgi:hypothetical protein